MQISIDFAKFLTEGWITPEQVGTLYSGALDRLHSQTAIFQMMGDTQLFFGVAALLSLPLVWLTSRWLTNHWLKRA